MRLSALAVALFIALTASQLSASEEPASSPQNNTSQNHFVYARGNEGSSGDYSGIYGFSVSSSTGKLTAVAGSPFSECGAGNPVAPGGNRIAMDLKGRFLYDYLNYGMICGWAINSTTGKLSAIPGSPFEIPGGYPAFDIAIDGSGKYLYGSTDYGGSIFGFAIDQSTGALKSVPGSPFYIARQPEWVAATPNGKFFYVADNTQDNIIAWSINTSTGELTEIGNYG